MERLKYATTITMNMPLNCIPLHSIPYHYSIPFPDRIRQQQEMKLPEK